MRSGPELLDAQHTLAAPSETHRLRLDPDHIFVERDKPIAALLRDCTTGLPVVVGDIEFRNCPEQITVDVSNSLRKRLCARHSR
jgi:hypothetical protein